MGSRSSFFTTQITQKSTLSWEKRNIITKSWNSITNVSDINNKKIWSRVWNFYVSVMISNNNVQSMSDSFQSTRLVLGMPSVLYKRAPAACHLEVPPSCHYGCFGKLCPNIIWDKSQFQVPMSKKSKKWMPFYYVNF